MMWRIFKEWWLKLLRAETKPKVQTEVESDELFLDKIKIRTLQTELDKTEKEISLLRYMLRGAIRIRSTYKERLNKAYRKIARLREDNRTSSKIGIKSWIYSLISLQILILVLIVRPSLLPTYNQAPSKTKTEGNTETKTGIKTKIESPLVWIDPGHEGIRENTGTQGIVTGTPEYRVNLEIAFELKKALEDQSMRVVMTREWNEVYIPNQERVRMANQVQPDLFLLIHCNGSENPEKNGSEVYYPPDRKIGIYQKSKKAAHLILEELSKIDRGRLGELTTAYENMDQRVCCGNSYLILKRSEVPAVLIEVGYLTNPREDSLLNSKEYQKKVAVAMSKGVIGYLLNNGWKITKTSSF